jgi:hypothetical protein
MPIVLTRLTRSISAAALMCVTVLSGAVAQSDAERRDTASVQQVYFRTLSTPASVSVVGDAQLALDLAIGAFGATAGRTADMALNLGRALNATQQFDAALSTLNSAKSIYEDLGADATLRAAVTDYEIGVALMGTGDMDGATKVLTEAYAMLSTVRGRRLCARCFTDGRGTGRRRSGTADRIGTRSGLGAAAKDNAACAPDLSARCAGLGTRMGAAGLSRVAGRQRQGRVRIGRQARRRVRYFRRHGSNAVAV